jgi:hypothetical protein
MVCDEKGGLNVELWNLFNTVNDLYKPIDLAYLPFRCYLVICMACGARK